MTSVFYKIRQQNNLVKAIDHLLLGLALVHSTIAVTLTWQTSSLKRFLLGKLQQTPVGSQRVKMLVKALLLLTATCSTLGMQAIRDHLDMWNWDSACWGESNIANFMKYEDELVEQCLQVKLKFAILLFLFYVVHILYHFLDTSQHRWKTQSCQSSISCSFPIQSVSATKSSSSKYISICWYEQHVQQLSICW